MVLGKGNSESLSQASWDGADCGPAVVPVPIRPHRHGLGWLLVTSVCEDKQGGIDEDESPVYSTASASPAASILLPYIHTHVSFWPEPRVPCGAFSGHGRALQERRAEELT